MTFKHLWQEINVAFWVSSPFLATFCLTAFDYLPLDALPIPQLGFMLPLTFIYYWSLWSPSLMPHYAVFIFGLINDAVSGMPLGITCFAFLLMYLIVITQSRYLSGRSAFLEWLGFTIVAFITSTIIWLLFSLANLSLFSPYIILKQFGIIIAIFPLLNLFFKKWRQHIINIRES